MKTVYRISELIQNVYWRESRVEYETYKEAEIVVSKLSPGRYKIQEILVVCDDDTEL